MVKHVTRRSYKNRASKKRRTIRKLKRTMRRKIQRGGNDGSLALVAPLVGLLLILFGGNPVVKGFFGFLSVIADGDDSQQGGNKRLNQMGGGKLADALTEFGEKITRDTSIPPSTKEGVIQCIKTLTDKDGISDAVIVQMNEPGKEDKDAEGIQRGGGLLGNFGENLAVFGTKLSNTTSAGVAAVKQKVTEFSSAQKVDFIKDIRTKIDKGKELFLAKVLHMKDEGNRTCMNIILSFGFDEAIKGLRSVRPGDITNAIAAKANAAMAKGADVATVVKEKSAQLFGQGLDLIRKPTGSNSPSSNPLPGNGEGPQVHTIKIKKGDNDTERFADLILFEEELRRVLKLKGWPPDDRYFGNAIQKYNNDVYYSVSQTRPEFKYMGGSDEIFMFALFSGMITTITFVDARGETVTLSDKIDFLTRYKSSADNNPYKVFKSKLFYEILDKTSFTTRSIAVKITTDFNKTPDYASFQAKAAAEANDALKAKLKAANIKTLEEYNVAKLQRTEAFLNKKSAEDALKNSGVFTSDATKLARVKALADATTAAKEAETVASTAFTVAEKAAKAAEAAGVLGVEFPK